MILGWCKLLTLPLFAITFDSNLNWSRINRFNFNLWAISNHGYQSLGSEFSDAWEFSIENEA